LRAAIDSALVNKRFLSPKIEAEIQETVQDDWVRPEGYTSDLPNRQREILVLLADGKTGKQIAQQLHISVKTVEFHDASALAAAGGPVGPDAGGTARADISSHSFNEISSAFLLAVFKILRLVSPPLDCNRRH
jgi:FixJ family two-component response regulator